MKREMSGCLIKNEKGFVLIASMLMLMVLTIIGVAATNTTTIELKIAGNDRIANEDFYDQEASLLNGKISYRDWLTTAYLTNAETTAFFPAAGTDANGNGINDLSEFVDSSGNVIGSYKVKNIVSSTANITGWEDLASFGAAANHPANNAPTISHRGKPDPGTGYDPKNFEVRRYVITSYSPNNDRKVVLQEGTYKVFNKF